MLQSNWIRTTLPALAFGACLALPAGAMAQTQFATECALKEIPLITLIEDHGEAGDVSAERLASASVAMLDARTACAEGRVSEALAMYQSVYELGPAQRSANNAARDTALR